MIPNAALRAIFPRAKPEVVDAWDDPLITEMRLADITLPHRAPAFLASVANETGGLTVFEEASYIGTPWSHIRRVFGSRAPSQEQLAAWKQLGRQGFDVEFFNWVYADANGATLGNTQPGDGYKFRGLGPGQTTGRGNFTWMQRETGLPLVDNPEMVLRPEIGAKIAAHFWTRSGCNAMVDDGTEAGVLRAMRKLNPGLSDFSPHVGYWRHNVAVLAGISDTAPPAPIPFERRREDVRRMQALLLAAGFDPKGVDGFVGPNTRAAIAGYEAAHGLTSDGVVDDVFLGSLGLKAAA